MQVLENCTRKINRFISQVDELLLSDFAHPASKAALNHIRNFFSAALQRLERLSQLGDSVTLDRACVTVNERMYAYLPIIGFISRSVDVRNSFESYDAFLQIAKSLIGDEAQVVMSSEWDLSPLTYPMTVGVLPNFVLLGMPTSESNNSLLLPLAGHELGHSVWNHGGFESKYSAHIIKEINSYLKSNWSLFQTTFPEYAGKAPDENLLSQDMFLSAYIVAHIQDLCLSQFEEVFCDAVGVALFGKSFAAAFYYLLAPSLGASRSPRYPRLDSRARYIEKYGGHDLSTLGLSQFHAHFNENAGTHQGREGYLISVSDQISDMNARMVYVDAGRYVDEKARQFKPDSANECKILRMFKNGTPSNDPQRLADILNAAWETVNQISNAEIGQLKEIDGVSELVLKSMEVLEFRRRVGHAEL
jgi:hypothetical protein